MFAFSTSKSEGTEKVSRYKAKFQSKFIHLKLFPLDLFRPVVVDLRDDVQSCVADLLHLGVLVVEEINEVSHSICLFYDERTGRIVSAEQIKHVNDL